ncbi:MAG: sporulation protein YabP [Clostridia bacterium]|nr:sporulation protein YabP [Clostridia bacterium]
MNELVRTTQVLRSSVNIENRERISITGIVRMESFDEGEVCARCENSTVTVLGQGLHITRLDLDNGVLVVDGFITGLEYADADRKDGLLSRLFR